LRLWTGKFKEVVTSVLPITLIVVILSLTMVRLETDDLIRFILGALFITAGLTIFLVGIDLGVSPLGNRLGDEIVRRNRLWIVIAAGLVLGFFISVAEPDLHILANQVTFVTDGAIDKWGLVLAVSGGVGALVAVGLSRVLFNFPLYKLLTVLYGMIFILSLFAPRMMLAIAFDASGATTGAMTVPFLLSLAMGVSAMKKDGKASEKDSFGLVATASAGAIIAVLVMSLFARRMDFAATIDLSTKPAAYLIEPFVYQLKHQALEATLAILPMLVVLLLTRSSVLKLKKKTFLRLMRGFAYTWAGLVLFLAGVNAGFMLVGRQIGEKLAQMESKLPLIAFGFVLGLMTILAEPAVHVLTRQIEDVTSGSIRRQAITVALSLGVGTSVLLSMLRILIPPLQLWHILLPGYIAAIILAHRGSKLFVGIAFDFGGVASGPMTATFILAYAQGAANAYHSADVLIDGFGVIALVALTPVLTLQILGLIYRKKSLERGRIHDRSMS